MLRVVNAGSGDIVAQWPCQANRVVVSPDASSVLTWLLAPISSGGVTVWDIKSRTKRGVLAEDGAWYCADGKYILTAKSHPNIDSLGLNMLYDVRLWDAQSLQPIPLPNHPDNPRDRHMVWFASDGRRFLDVDSERCLCIWSLRRPWPWWGVAWLWETWAVMAFGAALMWFLARDRRVFQRKAEAGG